MSILPTLPGCGQPADQLSEIYQPDETDPYRSLVGHGYACRNHLSDLITAVILAGLTPLYIPAGPLAVRACGERYEFETAGEPERPQLTHQIPVPGIPPVEILLGGAVPPEMEHPAWCARGDLCRLDQVHASRAYPATTPEASASIRLWLERRHAPAEVSTMVVVEVTEDAEPRLAFLPVDQARVLDRHVRWLVDQAAGR
jgi:hypothetical protein